MHNPNGSGRLIKWKIQLAEFDIKYNPRTIIKSQTLVASWLNVPLITKKSTGRKRYPKRVRKKASVKRKL